MPPVSSTFSGAKVAAGGYLLFIARFFLQPAGGYAHPSTPCCGRAACEGVSDDVGGTEGKKVIGDSPARSNLLGAFFLFPEFLFPEFLPPKLKVFLGAAAGLDGCGLYDPPSDVSRGGG
jgi:hypothetical protein